MRDRSLSLLFYSFLVVLAAGLITLHIPPYAGPKQSFDSPSLMRRLFRNIYSASNSSINLCLNQRSSSASMSSSVPASNQEEPATFVKHPLALPDIPSSDTTQKLDVGGEGTTVTLDHLGPMIVNQDGTLSRISNWEKMTETEQKNTAKIIGKRNKQRLDALKLLEDAEKRMGSIEV